MAANSPDGPLAEGEPKLPPRPTRVNTFVPWPTTLSPSLRLKFFLTGVVFPVICLGAISFGASPSLADPWQSGELEDFILVLVAPPPILVFFPLLMFSFVCLSVWCYNPVKFNQFGVWLGLVTGAIMACIFMLLLSSPTAFFGQMMAGFVAVALAIIVFAAKYIIRKRFSILYLLIVTTVVAAICAAIPLLFAPDAIRGMFATSLFFVIGGAPTLGMITFVRASFAAAHLSRKQRAIKPTSGSLDRPMIFGAWMVWLGAFAASWKYAIDLMFIEYAKLPTNPPNCYVSSAAANGHRRLVKSEPIEFDSSGQRKPIEEYRIIVPVNLQMQRLKFLEIALSTLSPKVHRSIRFVYNKLGPSLARACQSNVWFSDLTFLALKPFEWLAIWIRIAVGVSGESVRKIYRETK